LSSSKQFRVELIQAGGETFRSAIHRHIHRNWNKEELPNQWKESIIVPICKKGDKANCCNYCEISLASSSYRMLKNILISRLSSHVDEIIRNISVGFDVTNQLLAGNIFCIRQRQEKKWEYNEKVHPLLINFKKPYDSIMKELL
jgi:hypothetical protein